MKITALITEYNPFHNGHLYHAYTAKKLTNADYVIAIMSGNYVQRGTPAIIDKYTRTLEALSNGIDLVLELPVCYSTASAELFAQAAVTLIDKLGIVDYLCFGSECNNINILSQLVDVLIDEPAEFKQTLSSLIKTGLSYPAARSQALLEYFKSDKVLSESLSDIISSPNNILAIEYMKSLKSINSSIIPISIKREGSYNASELSDDNILYSSALAIRNSILSNLPSNSYLQHVPATTYEHLTKLNKISYPILIDDFSDILYYCLVTSTSDMLVQFQDVDITIANKLKNSLSDYTYISDYLSKIKTKELTYSRLSRAVLHIILGIKKSSIEDYKNNNLIQYARILGFNKEASRIIKLIKNTSNLIIINKITDAIPLLNKSATDMLITDINSSHLYRHIIYSKFNNKIFDEYRQNIIIV